jgi:DNA-binding CsgD family transcriptional regulator
MAALHLPSYDEFDDVHVAHTLPVAIVDMSSGRLTAVNPAFAAIFDLDPDGSRGVDLLSLLEPDERPVIETVLRAVADGTIDSCQGRGHLKGVKVVAWVGPVGVRPRDRRVLLATVPEDDAADLALPPVRLRVRGSDGGSAPAPCGLAPGHDRASDHPEPRDEACGSAEGWDRLTRAERRVVELLGDGLTNREIAERLFVSPRTVETHLSHVYDKLGVRRRAHVAAEVLRRGALDVEEP